MSVKQYQPKAIYKQLKGMLSLKTTQHKPHDEQKVTTCTAYIYKHNNQDR